jgi:hypothetical protein
MTQATYPSTTDEKPLNADILGISPHRVYLVSLQHYLYILSVALVLTSRWTGVTRYVAIWCPDFPPSAKANDDKAVCGAKVAIYQRRNEHLNFGFL